MPTEFRFDDLDLREEPSRGDAATAAVNTYATINCTSKDCTPTCCSNYTMHTSCC